MSYETRYAGYLEHFNARLNALCEEHLPNYSRVAQAARYSLLGGGKRVRAVLVLATCDALNGDMAAAADFAVAVEMLHAYSLIHDDLPCMDDDDLRRGKPSCHRAFDEATALLAGDLLLTEAFSVIAGADTSAEVRVAAAAALALGAGGHGMVYGQELDLAHEAEPVSEETLRLIHRHKTGALIRAAVQMGAAAAQATPEMQAALAVYAEKLGIVFQIVDDVLDATSTPEELGKPIGSDAANDKTTYFTLYGAERALQIAAELNGEATAALTLLGEKAGFLAEFSARLLSRRA